MSSLASAPGTHRHAPSIPATKRSRRYPTTGESLETRQLLSGVAFQAATAAGAVPSPTIAQTNPAPIAPLSASSSPAGFSPAQVQAAYGVNQVALNTASFEDGAYVEIANGAVVEEPISLLFVSTGGDRPVVSHQRSLIVMGPDSQATIVESYIETGEPIGSKTIARLQTGDVGGMSSATIRNEMAALAEAGLLEQPHWHSCSIISTSDFATCSR